jgi:hypothetical protein
LTIARAQQLQISAARLAEERDQDRRIAEFVQGLGKQNLNKLVASCPAFPEFASSLSPLPCPALPLFEMDCDLRAMAASIAGYASAAARNSNLAAVLDRDWSRRNRMICHVDQEPLGAAPSPTRCMSVGVCVCV